MFRQDPQPIDQHLAQPSRVTLPPSLSQRFGQLSDITGDAGQIVAGMLRNVANTVGVLLSGVLPASWTRYLNLTGNGTSFLKHEKLALNNDGTATFSGKLRSEVGNGTAVAVPTQLLAQFAALTSSSTVEVSLGSYSLVGNSLATNGDTLRITLIYHNTGAADQAIVKFGTTVLFNSTGNPGPTRVDIVLTRTASNAQKATVLVMTSGTVGVNSVTAAEDLTGAVLVDFRAKASVGTDVVTIDNGLVEALIT